MTWSVNSFAAIAVALGVCACATSVNAAHLGSKACVRHSDESLVLDFVNSYGKRLLISEKLYYGCCNKQALSVYLANASGVELKKCGRADFFEVNKPLWQDVGTVKRYMLSGRAISAVYCNAQLKNAMLVVQPPESVPPQHMPIEVCKGDDP